MPHRHLKLNEPAGDDVKTTTCRVCACRCGVRVHLRDGRVRYIDGNPQHPVNQGVTCAKGSAGITQHFSAAQPHKPLLRVRMERDPAPRKPGHRAEVAAEGAI